MKMYKEDQETELKVELTKDIRKEIFILRMWTYYDKL